MRILIALLVITTASAALWASLDRPLYAPVWHDWIKGVSYQPSGIYSNKQRLEGYPEALVRGDMEHLSKYTGRIRTYSMDPGLDRIPYLAREYGMKVSAGIWLSDDRALNEQQIERGIKVIKDNAKAVDRVFVGNEVVLRGELTAKQLAAYIARVREALPESIPVGTADVWAIWLQNPELAEASDFVGIHLLPYWEGIAADKAMDYVEDRFAQIEHAYPDKPIVIAEAGWPSEGRVKKGSVPSPAMEAYFLREFLTLAVVKNYDYYVIEAYDQPWKAEQEGAVGAYWGIFDADRAFKFDFEGPLSSFPQWRSFALMGAAVTFAVGLMVLTLVPAMRTRGYMLLGGIVALVASGALFIVEAASLRYVDWGTFLGASIILPAGLFTAVLLVTETAEWALALWRQRRRPPIIGRLEREPFVSIHVPAHNEPPLMVMQTLAALSRLAYANYEVIVLDNNTADDSLWKPVEAYCQTLGPRFRFYHFDNMKGFKAGALNKALDLTDPAAEYIAVIDSDYQVAPHWLKTVMPGFADPKVAVVQAPQDYRDAHESLFKAMCYEEYTGFFRVGMVERSEHNAIIQHGTMCVIRRAALEEVGRWSEWCITEDTELGLRLFEAGYEALYTAESLGRGLMPDTYGAYKGQRYRWVYGAMQILKKHAAAIFSGRGLLNGRPARLTPAQRYHFLAGWLPWFADGFALLFGVFALIWTALMTIAPRHFDVPLTALSGVALALFTLKTVKTVWLHSAKVSTGFAGALAAALTGLSLAFTVGKGVIAGLFTSGKPFLRTPKCESTAPWTHALQLAAAETAMLAASLAAIGATVVTTQADDPAEIVWIMALAVLAVPYAAAVLVAVGSTLNIKRRFVLRPEIGPAFEPPKLDVAV